MPYNASLHNQLPVIGREDTRVKAYLVNLDDQKTVWSFLVLPEVLSYSASNNFSQNYAMFSTKPNTRYKNSDVGRFSIGSLTLTTPGHIRSLRQILKDLEALRFPLKDKLSPPKLSFVILQRSIKPLYLERMSFDETEHLNGEPTMAIVSMEFIGAEQIQF